MTSMQTEPPPPQPPTGDEGFWEADATDIQGIEKALAGLRKQYGSAEAAQEGHAGTRNSVANLVVYASTADDAEAATTTLAALAGRHPARTLLIAADSDAGGRAIRATVSAACTVQHGQRICYEEIRLHSQGDSGAQLRSIVDPLLISDLPTYLWWTGDPPFRDDAFRALAGLSDRVLFDSARFRYPDVTLARLSRFLDSDERGGAVGDLNWNRLASLRELVAQLFDPAQTAALLPNIRRVRIERAASSDGLPGTAQSLLLAGWLAARLDWEPGPPGERTFGGASRVKLRHRGRDVVLELRSAPYPAARPGDVQSLQLQADTEGGMATLTIARSADQQHASTRVQLEGAEPVERSVRYLSPEDAELLGGELDELQPDRAFMEAAEMAGRIVVAFPREGA